MPFEISQTKRKVIFAIMFTGTFVSIISQSMMISALPTIMGEFAVNASLGQLLTTSYIFTLGLIAAMTAFLIDRINTKHLFIAAMSCFVLGCAATLLAPNYWFLLASRILQAGGAGIALPLTQVVALTMYPKEEYGKAMGIIGLIIGFAPAIGPAISGIIIDVWSWRAIFIILGGLVSIIAFIASIALADLVDHTQAGSFDVNSALLYVAGAIFVMVGITAVEQYGYWDPFAYIPALIGAGLIVWFTVGQCKSSRPLLKMSLLRIRGFWASVILVVLSQVVLMIGAIMVPLYVQDIQHLSATTSGFIILPGAIVMGFANPITGRIHDRFGARPLILAGVFCMAVGTYAFTLPLQAAPPYVITLLYGLRMIGVSCLMMPMTAHASTFLQEEDLAQGTALVTSLRQIIGSFVTSILIAVMQYNAISPIGIDEIGFDASWSVQAALIVILGSIGLFAMPGYEDKNPC